MAVSEETKQICDSIEEIGTNVRLKYDQLDKRLYDIETRAGTSFMTGNQDTSLESEMKAELLKHNDSFQKFIRKESNQFGFQMELKAVQDMTFAGNWTGSTAATYTAPIGPVGSSFATHIRDIFPQAPISGSSVPTLIDAGGEGNPAPTAEGASKPVLDYDIAAVDQKVETIAGILVVSRQFMADVPQAMTWLSRKLVESYMLVEDDQLLSGDGTSPNLKGINAAGNYVAATSLAAENDVVQLVTSIGQLIALNRTPSAIILHPTNLTTILLNVASGSGEFDLPSYVSVGPRGELRILNVPVVTSTSQTLGTFNVIDSSGFLFGIRENLTVQAFEQDSTNIRQNKITLRVEARVVLAAFGSNYNIMGTFFIS